MKERFAYLMLGGDISGGGNRHCPARTVSDAITNLYSSTLDIYNKLEPLELDRRANWRREMKFLLAPCDLISVCDDRMEEDAKTGQLRQVQVRIAPRADMISCLPALKMLDNLLLEMMDSFEGIDLAYDGSPSSNNDNPIPLVPEGGFSKKSRRLLKKQHESATQVYKAASHINSSAIADMDIPQSYTESLPKTAKAILGGVTYHHMLTVEPFKPDELVDNFNLTSEHKALETVDKLEAAIAIWSRKASGLQAKPWWKVVKEFVTDADIPDKNTVLAKRAETTIMRIKCRYPQFPQTSLEASKIENNKDMGKAVLETYSRVLESLALKLVSLIEGVMVADGLILPEGKISV